MTYSPHREILRVSERGQKMLPEYDSPEDACIAAYRTIAKTEQRLGELDEQIAKCNDTCREAEEVLATFEYQVDEEKLEELEN